jgi:hypothetical protein
VHVGTADAGVVDGDQDVVGVLDLGAGALLEGDVVGFVEDEGEVLWALLVSGWSWMRGRGLGWDGDGMEMGWRWIGMA